MITYLMSPREAVIRVAGSKISSNLKKAASFEFNLLPCKIVSFVAVKIKSN